MHPTVVFAQCGDMGQMTGYGNWQINQPLAVKRWVVERTNAWSGKYRRNSKDYERTTAMAEAMIQTGAIHLMLNRLAPDPNATRAEFRYVRKPLQKAA